ncbi:YesL family protein [Bacillus sp. USDA818B3_A]|uniref:YesL family protein n=1 Tax=Bacillus sp. USDA818B3_A TaxID=2698834 RepID=UPI001371A97D|nr:YesL family protein [Bacillus sp. USDA818B3_A]
MFRYDGKFFRVLEVVTAFFQLNIIWLILCIPVVTIFPATVAMYCVSRQWVLHNDFSVFRPFFKYFKENFKQSFGLGLIWLVFSGLGVIDFLLLRSFGSFQYFLLPILTLMGILLLLISIFIFPTIANFNLNWLNAIKNSLFFSIRYLPTTIAAILYIGLMGLILFTWPITILFVFSLGSYSIYLLCNRIFKKIQQVNPS